MSRNKYHVSPKHERTIDGVTFASKREMEHYLKLRLCQRAGAIKTLALQPRFILQDAFIKNGVKHRAIVYVADFDVEWSDGRRQVVDVKGCMTPEFKLKRKLFEARYPDLELEVWK